MRLRSRGLVQLSQTVDPIRAGKVLCPPSYPVNISYCPMPPLHPAGTDITNYSPSVGSLQGSSSRAKDSLVFPSTTTANAVTARFKGGSRAWHGLKKKGTSWWGACPELVRARMPSQDKVRCCPPLIAHPICLAPLSQPAERADV